MNLSLGVLLTLAHGCAPIVAPETLLSVASAESGFDPLTVAVNVLPRQVYHPANAAAAIALSSRLISEGRSVDLGLGQINSRNLTPLRLTLADAFEPCRNLAASAAVLADGYRRAAPAPGAEQAGLLTALSYYNTGDASRGLRNGYAGRVQRAAARVIPELQAQVSTPASPPLLAHTSVWSITPPSAGRIVF